MSLNQWIPPFLFIAQSQAASTVAFADFDHHVPGYTYSYVYSEQGGALINNGGEIRSEEGSEGVRSNGLSLSVDFSELESSGSDYSYSGFGVGVHFLTGQPLPTHNLSDYRVRLDLLVQGQYGDRSTVAGQIDLVFNGASYSKSMQIPVNLLTSGWNTLVVALPVDTFTANEIDDFSWNYVGVTTIDLRASAIGGPGHTGVEPNDFGFDSGNLLAIDNVKIFTIPEPSIAWQIMMGTGVLLCRSRRPSV